MFAESKVGGVWKEAADRTPVGMIQAFGGTVEPDGLFLCDGSEKSRTAYFNARYYDPIFGRFITEDPSRKGAGWYTYCSNNPINRTDPTGRYDPDGPDRGRWASKSIVIPAGANTQSSNGWDRGPESL
jgi:RHS repeat-associated protein